MKKALVNVDCIDSSQVSGYMGIYIYIYICEYIFDSAHVEHEFDRGKVLGSTGIVLHAPIVD